MFQLSRRADYAIRAMVHLAGLPQDEVASVAAIAQHQQVPAPFLAQIAAQLATAGLVQVRRGRSGGLALTRPATVVTLLEVIETIEGSLRLNRCVLRNGEAVDECPLVASCPVHDVWCRLQDQMVSELRQVTLAELAACHQQLYAASQREQRTD